MNLHWEKRSWGNACEIHVVGTADLAAEPALKRLERMLRKERDIVMNVAGLEYADTTFLRFLLRVRSREGSGNEVRVTLTDVSPRLQRILEITGLSRIFSYQTPQQA